jgi:hypothetical protein
MDIDNIPLTGPSAYSSEIQRTDISISDTQPLPKVPKNAIFANPKFIAQSYHSQVYSVNVTVRGNKKRALLKLFPRFRTPPHE